MACWALRGRMRSNAENTPRFPLFRLTPLDPLATYPLPRGV